MDKWSVYLITNKINQKGYVGITTKPFNQRLNEHFEAAFPGQLGANGRIYALHAAIQKYGAEQFLIELLESGLILEEAQVRETYWINHCNTFSSGTSRRGYNMSFGGEEPDFEDIVDVSNNQSLGRGAGSSEIFQLNKIAETDRAILVSPTNDGDDGVWLPKSQIEVLSRVKPAGGGSSVIEIEVPRWLVENEDL